MEASPCESTGLALLVVPEPDSPRQKASGLLQRGELKVSSELVHSFHALLSQKPTWTEAGAYTVNSTLRVALLPLGERSVLLHRLCHVLPWLGARSSATTLVFEGL